MSMDASDLVDSMLTEQARVNTALDDGDVNSLVADYQSLSGEKVGMTETVTPTAMGSPPHKWDDPVASTAWGFFSWV